MDPPRTILAAQVRDRFHLVPSPSAWYQRLGASEVATIIRCADEPFGPLPRPFDHDRKVAVERHSGRRLAAWVVSSDTEIQIHPVALPRDLIPLALAVFLKAGHERQRLRLRDYRRTLPSGLRRNTDARKEVARVGPIPMERRYRRMAARRMITLTTRTRS
jgi:hypothetical protein